LNQSNDRLGRKVNIGIDKHEKVSIRLIKKASDGDVTSSVDKGLILGRVNHEMDVVFDALNLKPKNTRCKSL
jgi:hypothetical protein